MSLTAVIPYFRAQALEQGWHEWKDAFNTENIPGTLIDRSFHIQMGRANEKRLNQYDLEMIVPLQVKYYKKGFKDPASARDAAISSAETFAKACLKASNRLTGAGIKNVSLIGFEPSQYANTNDNIVVVQMEFTALVIIGVES